MDNSEFRRQAHKFVDWMADYLDNIEDYPVKAQVKPGDIAAFLPDSPPTSGEDMDTIFRDFQDIILPGMTHWQHPGFMAYFPANASPPSVLAEMLTSTLAAQCMSWQTSPAATELEERMMDWLRQLTGLPEGFVGCIQDTASTATLAALLCARERLHKFSTNHSGLSITGTHTTYASAEVHSSVDKAVRIAGLGSDNLRKIPVDANFAMIPEDLEHAIESDLIAGCVPTCVVATLGSTSLSAIDPIRKIGEICQKYNIWLHVDAAWAGSALILPEFRWMIDGVELADSLVFNPHKWLLTQFDCSAFFVRDKAALIQTFEILPEYLKTREGDRVNNYRDWGVQLGRRFRALKLWFVLRSYGLEGLQTHLRKHIGFCQNLAQKVEEHKDFELLAPHPLALFCFRFKPAGQTEADLDALNETLLEKLNDSGRLYLTQTRIQGQYALRFVSGSPYTEQHHIDEAWALIQNMAQSLTKK
ncbi:pyridoxal phosphate-dependent decarboxylase family protein [Emcibacter sp.]|uniref:pyridoxal phosphate-dependent decarboxylase family protein n=1 Tax=Emcibacter sp. TaxID=1979954 RepID=UPI002AA69473|nr:pyridoxal-dependent decarboxylase [Emcibacter sp.]